MEGVHQGSKGFYRLGGKSIPSDGRHLHKSRGCHCCEFGKTEGQLHCGFLQNPNLAPTLADRDNKSRPDGYLVLRNKEDDGNNVRWANIVLSCEYKWKDDVEESNDVRIYQGL